MLTFSRDEKKYIMRFGGWNRLAKHDATKNTTKNRRSFRRADGGTFFQVGALKRTLDFPYVYTYVRYVVAAELFQ